MASASAAPAGNKIEFNQVGAANNNQQQLQAPFGREEMCTLTVRDIVINVYARCEIYLCLCQVRDIVIYVYAGCETSLFMFMLGARHRYLCLCQVRDIVIYVYAGCKISLFMFMLGAMSKSGGLFNAFLKR